MSREVENIFKGVVTLFIVLLLGYAFYIVLSALSPAVAALFAIAIAIMVIGILIGIFRR